MCGGDKAIIHERKKQENEILGRRLMTVRDEQAAGIFAY